MADSFTIRDHNQSYTFHGRDLAESMNGQRPFIRVYRNCLGQDEVAISVAGLDRDRVLRLDSIDVIPDLIYCLGKAWAEHEHCQRIGDRIVDGFISTLPDNSRAQHTSGAS